MADNTVVYHLLENSGNYGWNVNGKRFFDSPNWKIPEMNGSSEKVVLFSRLERFEWISFFHLHVPPFSHQFQALDDFSLRNVRARSSRTEFPNRTNWIFFVNGQTTCVVR